MVRRIARSIVTAFINRNDESSSGAEEIDTAAVQGFVEHIGDGTIEGWVIDTDPVGRFTAIYQGNPLPIAVTRHERVDVKVHHLHAPAKAGFLLTINPGFMGHSPFVRPADFEIRYDGQTIPFIDSPRGLAEEPEAMSPAGGKAEIHGDAPAPSEASDKVSLGERSIKESSASHTDVADVGATAPARHPDAYLIDKLFDADFYLSGFLPDQRPQDPASHYLTEGWQLGRDPAPWFSSWHYLSMNPDVADAGINPFLHYCIAGHREGRSFPKLGKQADEDVFAAHAFAVAPGPHFEEFDSTIAVGRRKRAKVLAYYLPQFHSVEVNNESWGKGFTEWRNLPRALPRFKGHIQPRIPRDLGCYDLSESDVMRRQIEMAKAAGLHGFCFYHYWFDGERVLEKPMERLLADSSLDFPFCLMWANENWTRTWDGSEREVILKQSYREEDDLRLLDDLARHMKDPRYICVGDRPLLFIYRPGHIPEAKVRIAKWRELMLERHGLNPLIFNAQAFGDDDPRRFDLDGAIEFPPHKVLSGAHDISGQVPLYDQGFSGSIRDYEAIHRSAASDTAPDFPLIRTVFPSWDNDARRPGRGVIVANSTPEKFSNWLDWAISFSQENPVYGDSIVCINAWNEWAEGAYLEPDVHYGSAYLNAVSRVVHGISGNSAGDVSHKILLVGHDTLAFGAQTLLVKIGETLARKFGCEVTFLILSSNDYGGSLKTVTSAMREIGAVIFADELEGGDLSVARRLMKQGFRHAITNTTPAGRFVPALKSAGFKVVSLVHELPNLLKSYGLEDAAKHILDQSDHVIFPAESVRRGFEEFSGKAKGSTELLPQGLFNSDILEVERGDNGVRAELSLEPGTRIVLGVGYADLRKGIDRFVAAALSICSSHDDIAFVWIGSPASETTHWFQPEIDASGLGNRIQILNPRKLARYYAAANVFYLASREDPFPSVVLEALASGLPIVGHEGTGGCDDLIRKHGVLVSQNDPMAVTDAILQAIAGLAPRAVELRKREIIENYDFPSYVFDLIKRLLPETATVSAVVPNYKYEAYIGERLRSVFDQNYPLREVIVLDDASPDNSVAKIERTAAAAGRTIDLHVNSLNSGSPFPQWRKGVELAQGEYVWIAEADDLADPAFVSRLVEQMQLAGSVIGFTDSRQIDEKSSLLGDSYKPYVNQIEQGAFDKSFDMDGREFLARYLSIKNVILNVSGVVFHRQTLLDAFDAVGDELCDYSVAGDWRLYAELCMREGSRVSYLAEPLNTHRRHKTSVTHALKVEKHLAEIDSMHKFVASAVALNERQQFLQIQTYKNADLALKDGITK